MIHTRARLLASLSLFSALLLSACSTLDLGNHPSTVVPSVNKATHVALLLPLQGSQGESGQATRNGFLAAYYYAKQNNASDLPQVTVIDTSGGNIGDLYQQAVAGGADFIVGPLTKLEVQTLANQGNLPVPTLALNRLPAQSSVANLYQFGLAPQDEAQQVALKGWQDGHRRVLIFAPASAWGKEVADSFQQQWQQQGGVVAARYDYPAKADFPSLVRGALGIVKTTRKSSLDAKPRQDVDMIFMLAFPTDARQIKPLLTFYNAGNIPVYSTSIVYSGNPTPTYDTDLDGVIFNDIPWIIGPDIPAWATIRDYSQTLWPDSYRRFPRLYALGVDAYHLTYVFNQLSAGGVVGATGLLTLKDQQVHRQLQWATIVSGNAQHQ